MADFAILLAYEASALNYALAEVRALGTCLGILDDVIADLNEMPRDALVEVELGPMREGRVFVTVHPSRLLRDLIEDLHARAHELALLHPAAKKG